MSCCRCPCCRPGCCPCCRSCGCSGCRSCCCTRCRFFCRSGRVTVICLSCGRFGRFPVQICLIGCRRLCGSLRPRGACSGLLRDSSLLHSYALVRGGILACRHCHGTCSRILRGCCTFILRSIGDGRCDSSLIRLWDLFRLFYAKPRIDDCCDDNHQTRCNCRNPVKLPDDAAARLRTFILYRRKR